VKSKTLRQSVSFTHRNPNCAKYIGEGKSNGRNKHSQESWWFQSSGTFLRVDVYLDANFSKELAVCHTGTRRVIFLDCLLLFSSVSLSVRFCVFLLHPKSSFFLSPLSSFILSVLYQLIGHYSSALNLKVWCQRRPTRMTFSCNSNCLTLGDKRSCSICFEVLSLFDRYCSWQT